MSTEPVTGGGHSRPPEPARGARPPHRLFLAAGAASAAVAVAAGAFGAHALRARLEPRMLEIFETGARYQMFHALALLLVAVIWGLPGSGAGVTPRLAAASGWCFLAGTVLFSGSLYALALTGIRALGAVTPLGGVLFIAGWFLLAWAACTKRD